MNRSWLQALKDVTPVPAPVALVLVGLGCYLGTCLVARRPLTWGWALVPGLVLSIVFESWEIWDHYGSVGLGGSSAAAIVARHLKDVALMNALPVVVMVVATFLKK